MIYGVPKHELVVQLGSTYVPSTLGFLRFVMIISIKSPTNKLVSNWGQLVFLTMLEIQGFVTTIDKLKNGLEMIQGFLTMFDYLYR